MTAAIERTNRLLSFPLRPAPRGLLVGAALLLVSTFFLPVWKVATIAPGEARQGTYSYELAREGEPVMPSEEASVAGPREAPADFLELRWVPFAAGVLGLLFLRAAAIGTMAMLVDVFVVFTYFALFSFWSFASRFSGYGQSYPGPGAFALAVVVLVLAAALFLAWRFGRSELTNETRMAG